MCSVEPVAVTPAFSDVEIRIPFAVTELKPTWLVVVIRLLAMTVVSSLASPKNRSPPTRLFATRISNQMFVPAAGITPKSVFCRLQPCPSVAAPESMSVVPCSSVLAVASVPVVTVVRVHPLSTRSPLSPSHRSDEWPRRVSIFGRTYPMVMKVSFSVRFREWVQPTDQAALITKLRRRSTQMNCPHEST